MAPGRREWSKSLGMKTMDDELIRALEAGEVPVGGFHHAQHVRVAWNCVSRYPLPEAIERFTSGLKRFAQAQGTPDLYHETITIRAIDVGGYRVGVFAVIRPQTRRRMRFTTIRT